MKTEKLEVTEREYALIMMIRNLNYGTLERIGVSDGQPDVIVASTQRIDLRKPIELERAISGGAVPIPMGDSNLGRSES